MRLVTRWLLQATFMPESTWAIPNPERAMGGLPRTPEILTVRTDSICNGINGLLGILELLGDDARLTIPDQLFSPVPKGPADTAAPVEDP